MDKVVTKKAAERILLSGGIQANEAEQIRLAERLEEIARAFFTTRSLLTGSRNRPLGKIGKSARLQLFGDLVGLFIEFPGVTKLPSATWRWDKCTHDGQFVRLAQAYCGVLADYIKVELENGRAIGWRSVMLDLRNVERNPTAAREGLRSILRPKAAQKSHNR